MLRELVSGRGCGAGDQSGPANPLGRLLHEGAAAKARNAQLQQFRANGMQGQLQGMMGPGAEEAAFAEAEAMAAAFEAEMEAGGPMMGGPPPPGMFMPPGADGGAWADEFHPGPPGMMMDSGHAWAQEMHMQHAMMRQRGPMGMRGMGPMAMMAGPKGRGPAAAERQARVREAADGGRLRGPTDKASFDEAWGEAEEAGLAEAFRGMGMEGRGEAWGREFEASGAGAGGKWAEEYAGAGPEGWAEDFRAEREGRVRGGEAWAEEFEGGEAEAWAEEFKEEREGGGMASALEEILNKDEELSGTELRDFVAAINDGSFGLDGGTILGRGGEVWDPASAEEAVSNAPYRFSDANPFLGQDGCFATGVDLLQRGQVSEAVQALEAEVQQNPDNSDAWLTLGLAHAENDEDVKAIIALNRAVQADPDSLDALLALGVSHTNELEQAHALTHLRTWITRHPDYGPLVPPQVERDPLEPSHTLHQEVVQIFHRVLEMRPDDAELHTVLGVLYNLSYEYPKAAHHFREALRVSPDDYALWNKLGATLANSMHSQEAIDAYIEGLKIKPNYVRALANLGISYSNQEMYEEAASCYLKALSLNPEADHVWSSLRVVFNCMSRPDLAAKCDFGDAERFRGDVEF